MIEGRQKYVVLNKIMLQVVSELQGRVRVAIRPENIIISREAMASSARNMLGGTIMNIIPCGTFSKVILDVGIPLTAIVTPQAIGELDLKTGDPAWAIFKTSAVHTF